MDIYDWLAFIVFGILILYNLLTLPKPVIFHREKNPYKPYTAPVSLGNSFDSKAAMPQNQKKSKEV